MLLIHGGQGCSCSSAKRAPAPMPTWALLPLHARGSLPCTGLQQIRMKQRWAGTCNFCPWSKRFAASIAWPEHVINWNHITGHTYICNLNIRTKINCQDLSCCLPPHWQNQNDITVRTYICNLEIRKNTNCQDRPCCLPPHWHALPCSLPVRRGE